MLPYPVWTEAKARARPQVRPPPPLARPSGTENAPTSPGSPALHRTLTPRPPCPSRSHLFHVSLHHRHRRLRLSLRSPSQRFQASRILLAQGRIMPITLMITGMIMVLLMSTGITPSPSHSYRLLGSLVHVRITSHWPEIVVPNPRPRLQVYDALTQNLT